MRLFLLPLIIFIVVGITEDIFIFRKLSRLTRFKWLKWVHAVFSIAMLAMIVTAISLPRRSGSEEVLLAVHIVEEEDAGHVTVGNGAYHTGK